MRCIHLLLATIAVATMWSSPVMAAESDASAHKKVLLETYRKTTYYKATNHYKMFEKQGRWRSIRETDFKIAFDRAGGRLMIDKPEALIVLDGDKLRMRIRRFKDRHLELEAPRPLTYANLVKAPPNVNQPELPDLMFLLGEDPQRRESNIEFKALEPDPKDPRKRPRLQFINPRFNMIVHMEPQSHLISFVQMGWNPALMQRPAADVIEFVHRIEVETHNTALDDSTFAFDVAGSKPVASIEELQGRHPLIGKPAPAIDLPRLDGRPFQLGTVKARIVLIHFWATWFPGHSRELAQLARIGQWADEESKSVTVITVNLKENPQKVRSEVRKLKLALPVLLAGESTVAADYDALQLPRTVIVVDGHVDAVLDSLGDDEAVMQRRIERVLSEPAMARPGRP